MQIFFFLDRKPAYCWFIIQISVFIFDTTDIFLRGRGYIYHEANVSPYDAYELMASHTIML